MHSNGPLPPKSGKGGRYYAAHIVEQQVDCVKLKWHEENIYSCGDKPSSLVFYKSTDKCVSEQQNIKDYGVTGQKVCASRPIKIPLTDLTLLYSLEA